MSNKKLVLVTNIPNQYRIPFFNELQCHLEKEGRELYVVFGAIGYDKRKSIIDLSQCHFQYEILSSNLFQKVESKTGFLFYSGLLSVLRKLKADQIIVAGYSFATLKIWGLSFLKKIEYFIWSGSIERKSEKRSFLRIFQRKLLIRRAKGLIAYGTLAKKYFESLGAESSRVFSIGNTVDTQFFEEITSKIRASKSTEERKHLTYIGYLNPRKNVQALLLVVKELSILREDFVLDIVGDGESRKNLETLVAENKLEKFVVFHGFKQKEELPEYLAVSNCFLFQTDFDIWGLVLNEAMASGVPCLASINAGATEDLIKEGQTGFKIDFNNFIHVAKQIDFILNQPSKMKEVSKNASVFIQKNYSLSNCAKRMMSAVYNEI